MKVTIVTIKSKLKYKAYSDQAEVFFGVWRDSGVRAKFPVSPRNHVGFTPRLLYSSTHHSPESFIHLETGWAQDAWLQWSYENWCFHLDISFLPSRGIFYQNSLENNTQRGAVFKSFKNTFPCFFHQSGARRLSSFLQSERYNFLRYFYYFTFSL